MHRCGWDVVPQGLPDGWFITLGHGGRRRLPCGCAAIVSIRSAIPLYSFLSGLLQLPVELGETGGLLPQLVLLREGPFRLLTFSKGV